jgi:collagen type III alpha
VGLVPPPTPHLGDAHVTKEARVTSEYPSPGQTSGPDQQDAPRRAPSSPGTDLTPFAAFGETSRGDGQPPHQSPASGGPAAPVAAARAAVRIPGLVTSAPPAAAPPTEQPSGGRVYGRPAGAGSVYGGPPAAATPAPDAGPAQRPSNVYGSAQPRAYGQPYAGAPAEASGAEAAPAPVQRTSTVYGQRQQAPADDRDAPYSAPPAAQPSAPPFAAAQQFSGPPARQFSGPPAQQFSAPPAQQFSAPPSSGPAGYGQGGPGPDYAGDRISNQRAQGVPQQRAPQAPERPQFEQHGRQTQGTTYAPPRPDQAERAFSAPQFPGELSFPDDRPRSGGGWSDSDLAGADRPPVGATRVSWQDQLEPMVTSDELRGQAPAPMLPRPAEPEAAPKNKLRLVGYLAIVVVVIALGVGALYYTSRTSPPKVGSCVRQSGTGAVNVSCSAPGAYEVVKSVTDNTLCPDYLNEPSLTYESGGKTTVLCLQQAK